jgi:hypothetical protein
MLTSEALAGIVTWLLTAGTLYCLCRQYMGKYNPPVLGKATGEKVVQYARNADLKEKMTQVKDSCTSVFRRREHGSTETTDANADEKDNKSTTKTLGSIFSGLKHRSTGTDDQESKRKNATVSPPALSTGTEQKTGDNIV